MEKYVTTGDGQTEEAERGVDRLHPEEGTAGQAAALEQLLKNVEQQTSRLQEALLRSNLSMEGFADQCDAMRDLVASLQETALAVPVTGSGMAHVRRSRRGGGSDFLALSRTGNVDAGAGEGAEGTGPLPRPPQRLTLREVRDRVEKEVITAAIKTSGGNVLKASEMLGVSRPALYDLMKKHGLFKPGMRH